MCRRVIFLLALLAAGCGKETARERPSPAPLLRFVEGTRLDPDGAARLDFGEVVEGKQARAHIVLENLGDTSLPLEIEVPPSPFQLVDAPTSIAPHAQASLVIRFVSEGSAAQGTFRIRAGRDSLRVRLQGQGIPPAIGCTVALDPPALRLTVGPEDPGLPWEIPVDVVVEKGRCTFDEVRAEGDLTIEVEDLEGRVFLEATRTKVKLRVGPARPGEQGVARLHIGNDEVDLPIQIEATSKCVSPDVSHLQLETGLYCDTHAAIAFEGCEEPPVLLDARVWPEDETLFFKVLPGEGTATIRYEAIDPLYVSDALFAFDFSNGDRVYARVEAEPEMLETSFVVPERLLDLIVVLDKSAWMNDHIPKLEDLAAKLWTFVQESSWDVSIAVTTTALGAGSPDCPAENGGFLPRDGSRPRFVTADTPDGEEVLLQNLQPDFCAPLGESRGLEVLSKVVSQPPPTWRRPGASVAALFFTVEDDAGSESIHTHAGEYTEAGIERIHTIDRCAVGSTRYGLLAQLLNGRTLDLCGSFSPRPILDDLELDGTRPYLFELPVPAEMEGRFFGDESTGIFLFHEGVRLPSHGIPGWTVRDGGWVLRLEWGLAPGSEVRLRYPEALSICTHGQPVSP